MKYGIVQWSFPNGLYAFQLAAAAGYEGVQIETGLLTNGYYMTDPKIQQIYKEEAKRNEQEIISVVDNDLMYVGCQGDKDGEEYRQSVRAIDLTIEVAKQMRCKRIMLPMFFRSQIHPGQPETYERAVEVLQKACRCAMDSGLEVQVETSISAKEQLELIKAVGMSNLTNFYDFQNLYWYDGLNAVAELPKLMPVNGGEMHVCDGWGLMTDNTNGACLLGKGESHFDEQMRIICEYGWDGWLITENLYYLSTFRNLGNYIELAKRDLNSLKTAVRHYSR